MFAAEENENLELLTREPAPKRLAPVYGQAPYLPPVHILQRGMLRFESLWSESY
jgi:hypothetical protein